MKTNANSGLVIVSVLVLLALCWPARAIESGEQIQDMISHWKFDEGQGSIAYDSAGNNDGTIYGAVWTTGQIDGALEFDGVDDYVNVIDIDDSLDIENSITIAAWVKLNDLSDYYFIVGKQPTGTSRTNCPGNYEFRTEQFDGYLWLLHQTGTGDYEYSRYSSTYGIAAGAWHQVSVTLVEGGNVNFYIDGSPAGTVPQEGLFGLINDEPVRIGTRKDAWSYFNGIIDDLRIYDRALSPEEIWQLYQPTLPNVVALDIKPQSCPNPLNLKSRGVLPVAVLGSEDFDVNNIDVASIRLADVAPIRSSFDDVATPVADGNECECTAEGPDGYTDLTLKFKTQEIVEKLINAPNELVGGQTLSLTLTGALSDDTLIEGTDCVLLVGNVPRAIAATRADINGDGVVDFRDLTIVSNYWLESSEIE